MNDNKLQDFAKLFDEFKKTEHYQHRLEQTEFSPIARQIIEETLKNAPLRKDHLTGLIQTLKFNTTDDTFWDYLSQNVSDTKVRDRIYKSVQPMARKGYTNAGKAAITSITTSQLRQVKNFLSDAFNVTTISEAKALTDKYDALDISEVTQGVYSPWLHYINPKIFPVVNNMHKRFHKWMEIGGQYSQRIESYSILRRLTKEPSLAMLDSFAYHYTSDVDDKDWNKAELRAAVNAYVDMLHKERQGVPFNKKQIYESLAAKYERTAKAFEYRMQNISYVLSLMGRQWLIGLKPSKNVEEKNAGIIEELLGKALGQQSPQVAEFEMEVQKKRTKKNLAKPIGKKKPTAATANVTQYSRDTSVKAWVLEQAKGVCECCGTSAPFIGTNGFPYLEVHHVRQLADAGTDTITNAVAICPNCHSEFHYGQNAQVLIERLYQRVMRLVRE